MDVVILDIYLNLDHKIYYIGEKPVGITFRNKNGRTAYNCFNTAFL